jgi:hypothetical protein
MLMIRVCKTDQIRTAWAAGDRIGALRIAARFFDRSAETKIVKRGMDAFNHADFYTQLGKKPQELVTAALALLQKRFDLLDRRFHANFNVSAKPTGSRSRR